MFMTLFIYTFNILKEYDNLYLYNYLGYLKFDILIVAIAIIF